MQTRRSQPERVSVCDHESRPWANVRFRQGRKENFIFCSDITGHCENKVSNKYGPGGCVFSGSK